MQQFLYALVSVAAIQSLDPAQELQVFHHREVVVEGEFLGHVADLAPQGLGPGGDVQSQNRHFAGGRGQQAAEHADDRGLARAVGTQETVDLSMGYPKIDPVDGDDIAEVAGQPTGLDGRIRHQGSPRMTWAGTPVGRSRPSCRSNSAR